MSHPNEDTFLENLKHCVWYCGGMIGILEVGNHFAKRSADPRSNMFTPVFPASLAYTYFLSRYKHPDMWRITSKKVGKFGKGVVWGALGISSLILLCVRQGWYTLPEWGWQRWTVPALGRSVTRQIVDETTLVWTEEMLFRGYGYQTIAACIGEVATVPGSIVGFAGWHGLDAGRLKMYTLMSIAFLLLRLESEDIWLSAGFHWGWNFFQTAVFGDEDAYPSLIPVRVHDTSGWVGVPGTTIPSRIGSIWLGALSLIFGFRLWRKRRGMR